MQEQSTDFLANLIGSAVERREQLREQIAPELVELIQVELFLEALEAATPAEAAVWREEVTQRAIAGSDAPSIGPPVESPLKTTPLKTVPLKTVPLGDRERRQQVIADLEPRTCGLEGCEVDIAHMAPSAKYCSHEHEAKARRASKAKTAKVSEASKDKVWFALRDQRDGATVGQLQKLGIEKASGDGVLGDTAIHLALKILEEEKRVTSETKKLPVQTRHGTRLMSSRVYRHVPPQLRPGVPPDPTSRPRGIPPEVTALAEARTLERAGVAPVSGNYPQPKEGALRVVVKKAIAAGWSPQLDGKGAHRLRLDKEGQQELYVPMNRVGHHLARRVISNFRKAGVDC